MKFIKITILLLVLSTLTIGVNDLRAQVVVPNDLANAEGPSGNQFPWACQLANGIRYQQFFASSQFDGPMEIGGLRYRVREGANGFSSTTIPNVLITLSTTNATPDSFSTTYAENVGPDVTVVYNGPLTISGTACEVGPCPFDIIIDLQTPFTYTPVIGTLLLDVTIPVCGDFLNNFIDGTVNGPITNRLFNNDASDPTGVTDDDGALVTQFVEPIPLVRNVPTLSEWGLIAMAGILAVVGVLILKRRKAAV